VASAIDIVVQVGLANDGTRRVQEIAAVTGRFENDRAEIETLWKWDGSNYIRGIGSIGNEEKFSAAGIPLTDWWNKNE
jgi:pilus assembly protein CpaF